MHTRSRPYEWFKESSVMKWPGLKVLSTVHIVPRLCLYLSNTRQHVIGSDSEANICCSSSPPLLTSYHRFDAAVVSNDVICAGSVRLPPPCALWCVIDHDVGLSHAGFANVTQTHRACQSKNNSSLTTRATTVAVHGVFYILFG